MINPMKLMELKRMKETFEQNHPKFPRFVEDVSREAIREGTVVEITVTTPEGRVYCSNLKVQPSDLEMLAAIQALKD